MLPEGFSRGGFCVIDSSCYYIFLWTLALLSLSLLPSLPPSLPLSLFLFPTEPIQKDESRSQFIMNKYKEMKYCSEESKLKVKEESEPLIVVVSRHGKIRGWGLLCFCRVQESKVGPSHCKRQPLQAVSAAFLLRFRVAMMSFHVVLLFFSPEPICTPRSRNRGSCYWKRQRTAGWSGGRTRAEHHPCEWFCQLKAEEAISTSPSVWKPLRVCVVWER